MIEAESATTPTVGVTLSRSGGALELRLEGRLDSRTAGRAWRQTMSLVAAEPTDARLRVDASGLDYCDGAGLGLLFELKRRFPHAELRGLAPDTEKLLAQFDPKDFAEPAAHPTEGFVEYVGRATWLVATDMKAQVAFVGEMLLALVAAVAHPRRVRWRDTFAIADMAGVGAIPIIALIGFLIGLILAFQAAIPLKQFGADIFIADLVSISLVRELGPLMTAIIVAGRSGAAFAAEIGTMRVNEEVNALTTMGLSPVRFLVVPRVLAGLLVLPLLSIFTDLAGLVGGAVVFNSLGFPLVTYVSQISAAVSWVDLAGALFKSLVFGLLVAGIGCLRGLQVTSGASAVGRAATRAVVSGLVLIILTDGVFSVVFYVLGI